MKFGGAIASLLGLGLAAWLIARSGVGAIAGLLASAGPGIALVVAFHLTQMVASAAGWRSVHPERAGRPGLRTFILFRWIREAVNNLLPGGQIGGEFVCARLLRRRGVPLSAASAGIIADLTVEMLTQIVFTLFGLALLAGLLSAGPHPIGPSASTLRAIAGGSAVAVLVVGALLALQLGGGARLAERALAALSARFGWRGTADLEGLHEALATIWRTPRAICPAILWHGLSWLLGGGEIWIAMAVLGRHASLSQSMVIESIGQAAKAVGFAIPGALGVQEGGFVLIFGLLGLPADAAIALSLVKRLREIVLGVPGLLAWHHLERRPAGAAASFGPAR